MNRRELAVKLLGGIAALAGLAAVPALAREEETVPATGRGERVWGNFVNGTTNVQQFGAVGDGVTDDSPAFQAALNAAAAEAERSGGRVRVYAPPGRYHLRTTVRSGVSSLRGQIGPHNGMVMEISPGGGNVTFRHAERLEGVEFLGIKVILKDPACPCIISSCTTIPTPGA